MAEIVRRAGEFNTGLTFEKRIARLVRSAVGFDEKRGDKVEVVSMRFANDVDAVEDLLSATLLFGFERSDVMRLAQTAMFGFLALLAMLTVLRPMVRRLTIVPGVAELAGPGEKTVFALADGRPGFFEAGGLHDASPVPALTGPGGVSRLAGAGQGLGPGVAGLLEDESMVQMSNIDGQLRASSIRRVADLIDRHPDESMSIMRAWMHQEAV
jgi:flagellar M-ring protein FliF